jgi:hypothetical protein
MNRLRATLSTLLALYKRNRKASALTVFVAGVAVGVGLYIVIDGFYVKLTAPPPGAAAMTAIGNDLAESASIRPSIQAAIIQVQACLGRLSNAETALYQAISDRQIILQNLKTLSVSDLPNGARLVSTLTTAMQSSLDADNDYYAWMKDIAGSGGACGSNPGQDSNYMKAENASAKATTSKDAFLAIWNAMAPRYGQQTYSDTGI